MELIIITGVHNTHDINVAISGFPNQYTQLIDLLALPVPAVQLGSNYTIQFKVGTTKRIMHSPIASFTLYK